MVLALEFVIYTPAVGLPAFAFMGVCSLISILLMMMFLFPSIKSTPESALGRYFTRAIILISSDFHSTAVQSHAKSIEYDIL